MTLRSEAAAAYTTSQGDKTATARAALGAILTPYVVTPMTVESAEVTPLYQLVVFTDGDVHIGVRLVAGDPTWRAYLVAATAGEWTELVQITSLAQLGAVLPGLDPANTTPAWAAGLSVPQNALYTYGGTTWKAIKSITTKVGEEPPNAPSKWVAV